MSKKAFILIAGGYLILLAIFTFIEHKVLVGGWQGIIVGNLLANAYWAPLGLLHFDRLSRQHHKENMEAHKRTQDANAMDD